MHYKNGREAKVGDKVVGTVFNTKGIIAGTLVSLTPGTDACSAMVGFIDLETDFTYPSTLQGIYTPVRIQGTEQHGSAGPLAVSGYKQDYTECKNLLHAEDAFNREKPWN
ncbi:MAG TPA: hypothetical protein DCS05_08795 [Nitrospiraceae bacterium]|nr:hypothetical protein [Nitrospiraceae bacterium]